MQADGAHMRMSFRNDLMGFGDALKRPTLDVR
jgi:hypothetical protein